MRLGSGIFLITGLLSRAPAPRPGLPGSTSTPGRRKPSAILTWELLWPDGQNTLARYFWVTSEIVQKQDFAGRLRFPGSFLARTGPPGPTLARPAVLGHVPGMYQWRRTGLGNRRIKPLFPI